MTKVAVAAMLYCGCHVGAFLKVEKNQVQSALQSLVDVAPHRRYIAFYADGQWTDPHNYISEKLDWEKYFNTRLEKQ